MTLKLSEIYQPVQEDLAAVEAELKLVGQVENPWLSELLEYSLKGGGKRIRPIPVSYTQSPSPRDRS